ncbi:MAG: M28 family peptidase, partial [Erysipelotrichaceae bacterium]|nr:M28 family peptidase [Erysipelotrichaceae bacterium]
TLIPEFTGTFAYLSDHKDYEKGLGAMNLDMVGGKQTRFYGPITLTKTPYQTPALNNELCMIAMDEASKEASSLSGDPVALTNHRVEPHSGGSDHTVYCDPTVNIPCCMLGQWPDLNYHTATDTLDVIDPAVLKFSCLTAINFAYSLATINKEDLPYLFTKQDEVIIEDVGRYVKEYLDEKIDKAMFGSLVCLLKDYYLSCVESADKLVSGYDVSKQKKHVEKIFDNFIDLYDLKDDYPLDRSLNDIYSRKFVGPVQQFSDYRALGYGEVIDAYQEKTKKDPFAMMGVQDLVTNLIDGRNTVGQIVRKASLIRRKDVREAVLILLDLYEKLGLIGK